MIFYIFKFKMAVRFLQEFQKQIKFIKFTELKAILFIILIIESREKPGNDGKKGVIFIYIKN